MKMMERFKVLENDVFVLNYEKFREPFLKWAKNRLEYVRGLKKVSDYLRDSDNPKLLKFFSQTFKTFVFIEDLEYEDTPKPVKIIKPSEKKLSRKEAEEKAKKEEMVKTKLLERVESIERGELKPRNYPSGNALEMGENNIQDSEIQLSPIYFDKSGIWWLFDIEEKFWEMCDDVDILNHVESVTGEDIISSKNRTLILNTLKQQGRKNKPLDLPKSWIQFKKIIVDIKSGKEFEADSKYFVTNPIPYKLGESEETPTIDKLLSQWVVKEGVQDESYKDTLYEIIAYCICQDQFLQRIIALTGSGSNGKGTFLNLIKKFIGIENCCSSNLKTISTRNFEASALYKKLVCFFGEVDSSDLANANLIKSLTGEDLIRYEFKSKTPFSEESKTTPIIATNSLPITPDQSIGFYRRWLIVDFPNQFPIVRDLIVSIPEEEFENLGRKIVRILKELYETEDFTNAGTIEERTKRYELRSNPIVAFLNERFNLEGVGSVKLREFSNDFNRYLKNKRLRPLTISKIGKLLREDGYEIQARDFPEGKSKAIIGIEYKSNFWKKKDETK